MVEDIYKNKLMTFEDIDRLSLKQFTKGGQGFVPQDLLDLHESDDDGDNEILRKLNPKKKAHGHNAYANKNRNLQPVLNQA